MKRYNEYIDSGIEWLGEVPEHWNSVRIDWTSKIVRGNTSFKKDELLDNGEYVALQYGKTYKVDEVNNAFKFFVNSEFYKSGQVVHNGDTILISTSETIEDLGHSCFYNRNDLGLLGGEQILLKPNNNLVIEKYLYYYSKFFCLELKKYASGLKVFRFNIDDLKNIFILIPSIEEQTQIVNYLDAKTTAIDNKINLLEQKIKCYKAYRKTLINEVVTKGLDKTVKLKDSGIDWIGKIPKHWDVKRLKDLSIISTGDKNSEDFDFEGIYPFFVRSPDIKKINSFSFEGEAVLTAGDGDVGKVFHYINGKFDVHQRVYCIRKFKKRLNAKYLYYYMYSKFYNQAMINNSNSIVNSIRLPLLRNLEVPISKDSEQQQIADYLDTKTTTIDKIVKNIETQIATLKELRKTLINEVVTGKVKVKNGKTNRRRRKGYRLYFW